MENSKFYSSKKVNPHPGEAHPEQPAPVETAGQQPAQVQHSVSRLPEAAAPGENSRELPGDDILENELIRPERQRRQREPMGSGGNAKSVLIKLLCGIGCAGLFFAIAVIAVNGKLFTQITTSPEAFTFTMLFALAYFVALFCLSLTSEVSSVSRFIALAAGLALAVGAYMALCDKTSALTDNALVPAVEAFKAGGSVISQQTALAVPFQYVLMLASLLPMPSLYIVKLVALVGALILAAAVSRIVSLFARHDAAVIISAIIALLLPLAAASAALGCAADLLAAGCALFGLYFAISGRPYGAAVLIAAGLSFAVWTAILLPVFIMLIFVRQIRWMHILILVAAVPLLQLPALAMGADLGSVFYIYMQQIGNVAVLTDAAPSIWALLPGADFSLANNFAIPAAAAVGAALLFWAYRCRPALDQRCAAAFALLFTLALPFVLPRIAAPYFLIAAGLSLAYAWVFGHRIWVPLLTFAASLLCIAASAYAAPALCGALGALANAAAIALVTTDIKRYTDEQRALIETKNETQTN